MSSCLSSVETSSPRASTGIATGPVSQLCWQRMWEMGDAQRLKADPLRSVVAECLMTLLGRERAPREVARDVFGGRTADGFRTQPRLVCAVRGMVFFAL